MNYRSLIQSSVDGDDNVTKVGIQDVKLMYVR